MKVPCPYCKTTYNLASAIPTGCTATVTCVVCYTQLEVTPRGLLYAFKPKVVVRQVQTEQHNPEAKVNGKVG